MARRRRSRRFGGIVSLGELPLVNENVKALDVFMGVAAGFVGSAVVKAALQKLLPADTYVKLASTVGKFLPLVTGISAGAILYYAQKGMNRSRAVGHATGAVAIGLGMTVAELLRGQSIAGVTFSAAPVALDLSDYGGLLVDDTSRGMNGLIVADKSDQLSDLGVHALGEDGGDYSDIVELSKL